MRSKLGSTKIIFQIIFHFLQVRTNIYGTFHIRKRTRIRRNRNYYREWIFLYVRVYHIFHLFWEAPVGSLLIAKHEDDPQSLIHDKFAIALVNNDLVTVAHIPKFISKLTYFFLKHGGHIKCEITLPDDRCHERKTETPR